jgi:alpha-soluble NSF attachment protein
MSELERADKLKLEGKWDDAGDALVLHACLIKGMRKRYSSSARYYLESAARYYRQAAYSYRKADLPSSEDKTMKALKSAVDCYKAAGAFSRLADVEVQLGRYCSERGKSEEAAAHYRNAANFYDGEGLCQNRDSTLARLAAETARYGDHREAATIFEQIGLSKSNNKDTAFHHAMYYMKAGICYLLHLRGNPEEKDRIEKDLDSLVNRQSWSGTSLNEKLVDLIKDREKLDEVVLTYIPEAVSAS